MIDSQTPPLWTILSRVLVQFNISTLECRRPFLNTLYFLSMFKKSENDL